MFSSIISSVAGAVSQRSKDRAEIATAAKKARIAEIEAESGVKLAKINIQSQQIGVNMAEAQHKSIFVAGWRPFIGWVCGFAIAYHFIFTPITNAILAGFGLAMLPAIDFNGLYPLIMGMLGLGAQRSYEKKNGVARDKMSEQPKK